MTERILVVGEALVDVVHRMDGSIDEHPGGSPLNVAIGLARLGHPVEFASRFGPDRHGELIRAHLAAAPHLTLSTGTDQARRTSTARATLDQRGAASYEFDLVWDVEPALDARPVGIDTGELTRLLRGRVHDEHALAREEEEAVGAEAATVLAAMADYALSPAKDRCSAE